MKSAALGLLQALSRASGVSKSLFLVVSWLLVWQFGLLVEFAEHASVWFPAAGLTFAALLVGGQRTIPALVVSAVIVTFWTGYQYAIPLDTLGLLIAGLAFAAAHITPYLLASKILLWLSGKPRIALPHLIIAFLLCSAVFSLIATALVLFSLVQTGMMPGTEVAGVWLAFWIGDLAGVVVIAPLIGAILSVIYPDNKVPLRQFGAARPLKDSGRFGWKVVANLTLLTASMALAKFAQTPESAFAIFFLAVTHMWIACTESPLNNVMSLALSSFLIAFWVNTFGLMEQVMVYQFAILVVAANALFGIAVPTLTADNRKLREMVFTDSLTQAASREMVTQRAEFEIMHSHSESLPLSLIVFDIDHFKLINDDFGHTAGDRALRNASKTAQQHLRPTDILGRFGGDEFVVVLPKTTVEDAFIIAQRILESLGQIQVGSREMTCSFGVAELAPRENFVALFERADKALYRAKQAGRNQVSACSVVPLTTHRPG